MQFSKRMDIFTANIFNQLDEKKNELRAAGKEVINLSVGTPDFSPDKHVMEALISAASDPENYKYSLGDKPELIDSVIEWYKRRYGVNLERNEAMSVYGSQEGIAHIAFPLCNIGDVVLAPDPGYPIFSFGPLLAGAQMETTPLLPENNFLVDFDLIDPAIAQKAKMIIVSYPSNPVTAIANYEFYEKLVRFAKKHDIVVVHDNAYSELVFDEPPSMSFLAVPGAKEVGVEFNSLSKSYNLTGGRISFLLGNSEIIAKFKALRSQIDYGTFLPVQYAAIAALNGPQDILERNRAMYRERRDTLCQGLRSVGWQVEDTPATMFTWAPIPKKFTNSTDFVFKLLDQANVICVPGSNFGPRGEGFVRIALVEPPEVLNRFVEKIKKSGLL